MPQKILLVEDDALIAVTETMLLQSHGFEVLKAASGEKAVEIADSNPDISLVLMDIDLGKGIDGTVAAERILEKYELPIIFLTAHSEKDYVDRVRKITRYGYVLKNSGEFVLIESIHMAFELFEAHSALKKENNERREAEQLLEEKKDLLSNSLNAVDSLLIVLDHERRVILSNWKNHEWVPKEERNRRPLCYRTIKQREEPCEYCPPLEIFKDGKPRFFEDRNPVDGSLKEISAFPIFDNEGKVRYVLENVRDRTRLDRMKEELLCSEKKFRDIFDSLREMIFIYDTKGRLLEVNNIVAESLGYPRATLLRMSMSDLEKDCTSRDISERIEKVSKEGNTHYETCLQREDGKKIPVEIHSHVIIFDELPCILASARDISDRRIREDKLRESEEKYRMLYENAPLPYQSLDKNGCFLDVNPAWLETLGGYGREEVIGRSFADFIHPDSLPDFHRNLAEFKKKGAASANKYRMRRKDGNFIDVLFRGCISYSTEGEFLRTHCVFEDITEKKMMEQALRENETKFRMIAENTPYGLAVIDIAADKISYASPSYDRLYHREAGDSIDRTIQEIGAIIHPEDRQSVFDRVYEAAEKKEDQLEYEFRVMSEGAEGTEERWISNTNHFVYDNNGNWVKSYLIAHDITEQKRYERQLQDAAEEKDDLMKELNHRVKNNLLMVSSLIELKSNALGADVDLSDIERQIDAIRIIHEKLYQSEQVTCIDIGDYVQEILSTVFSFFPEPVFIQNNIKNLSLDTKTAVSLGLIINEFATNAVKHGFVGGWEAVFRVDMDHNGEELSLIISNSGAPFPQDIDIEQSVTLGLQLIQALTRQLGGHLELMRDPNPVFTLNFHAK